MCSRLSFSLFWSPIRYTWVELFDKNISPIKRRNKKNCRGLSVQSKNGRMDETQIKFHHIDSVHYSKKKKVERKWIWNWRVKKSNEIREFENTSSIQVKRYFRLLLYLRVFFFNSRFLFNPTFPFELCVFAWHLVS